MSVPMKLSLTPLTEEKLTEVGFERVLDKSRSEDEYNFVIRLPKNSADPHCMCLVSSYTTEHKELGLNPGHFIVELYDSGGLGVCASMEELDMLYFVLTKKSIYEK